MVIEKVHAFHTTKQSLHERFTLLMNAGPHRVFMQRKRRASAGSIISQNYNYSNRLIDQVARRLEMQAKRQGMRQRLGFQQSGGMRRFGSESSLPGLRRSNSFGNLSQQSVKSRLSWKQSNNNLSRSASFSNLTHLAWRGKALRWFHKRGGQRVMQRRYRNGRQNGQVNGFQQRNRFQRNGFQQRRGVQQRQGFQQRRGVQQRRGFQQRRGALRKNQQQNNGQQQTRAQSQQPQGQRPQVARRGRARGRGRGGITRSQSQSQLLMTKEQLDAQLDDYMSCTKAALDQELDNYMKNAMEME